MIETKCNAIELKDVGCDFGEKRVLEKINLSIEKGEIFGLLGPSGAGKTTMVNILTGQLKPTRGEVTVSTGNGDLDFGIMMDHFGLYERLTVYDNLKIFAKIFRVPESRVREVLERTRLTEAKKTAVMNLSKGMKIRLKLARAVLKDVEILFLDEPTSGLDPSTTKDIHEMLLEIREKGTTIFLTTHNMHEAQEMCDHVALLNMGEIIEYGKPEDICRKYNHLNKIQIHLKSGENLELANKAGSAKQIGDLFEKDEIAAIHSTEPNLESVFLELTGRRLE